MRLFGIRGIKILYFFIKFFMVFDVIVKIFKFLIEIRYLNNIENLYIY